MWRAAQYAYMANYKISEKMIMKLESAPALQTFLDILVTT